MSRTNFLVLTFVSVTTITGCSANMVRREQDDWSNPFGFAWGKFSYLDQGADGVIDSRLEDGKRQASDFCGGREIYFLGKKSTVSHGLTSRPVTTTAHHQGSLSGVTESVNYSGTSTSTSYQLMSYSTVTTGVSFICLDDDQDEEVYEISQVEDNAPTCVKVPTPFTPGRKRIVNISQLPSSDSCLKEGWLRYQLGGKKLHLFVGPTGKSLCNAIEQQLIDLEIETGATNRWLRKRLKCGNIKKDSGSANGKRMDQSSDIIPEAIKAGSNDSAIEPFEKLQDRAAKGEAEAEYDLGYRYELGVGCKANIQKALDWYKRSLSHGNKKANARIHAIEEESED